MNSNSDRTYQKYMPSDFVSYIDAQLECHPAKYDAKANILDYGSKTDAITTQAMLGRPLATEGGPLEANLLENYLRPCDGIIHLQEITMLAINLEQLAAVAQIIGVITIVSGLFFGWFQIRVNRARQRDTIVINLMQTFYHGDLARAVQILHGLPDGVSADELRKRGPEYEEAAVIITTSFETLGLLVYKKIAKFDMVIELTGGMVTSMYRKLQLWLPAVREEQNQPSWAEWFQWLALLAEDHKARQEPAFTGHRNWKP